MKYSTGDMEDILYEMLPKEEGYNKSVITAMNYAFKAGGKRLRPMMMKLCFDMFNEDCDEQVVWYFMAAIEMIHTYSLIHDDLPALDNDDLRRGMPTVHVKFGEDIAILAGDGLLNYAYEVASKAFGIKPGSERVEKAFSILASKPGIFGMIGGQTLDVIMSGKSLSKEELEYIYINKTSALIMCAMSIGAVLGGASEYEVEQINEAALAVGMAFQVMDDVLDIEGDEIKLGKPLHSDEKNDKTTFVSLYGLDEAKEYVRKTSEHAVEIIEKMSVKDVSSRDELTLLINSLVNRDK